MTRNTSTVSSTRSRVYRPVVVAMLVIAVALTAFISEARAQATYEIAPIDYYGEATDDPHRTTVGASRERRD